MPGRVFIPTLAVRIRSDESNSFVRVLGTSIMLGCNSIQRDVYVLDASSLFHFTVFTNSLPVEYLSGLRNLLFRRKYTILT